MSLDRAEQPVRQEEISDQQKKLFRKRSVVRETKGSLGSSPGTSGRGCDVPISE
jgi:hypothetical protein